MMHLGVNWEDTVSLPDKFTLSEFIVIVKVDIFIISNISPMLTFFKQLFQSCNSLRFLNQSHGSEGYGKLFGISRLLEIIAM